MISENTIVPLTAISAIFVLPFLGLMIWTATHYCYAAFRTWQEIGLKRDMVARGYTVAEIVAVVSAKRGCKPTTTTPLSQVPPAKPIKQPAYNS
jgi:hypothetical protein